MNKIPATSQFSLLKGIWFVCRDGDREIAHHNSILGLERIFINGKLIFKKRILSEIGKSNKRQFTFEGNIYEVLILTSKVQTTQIEGFLVKDGICLEKFKLYYKLDQTPVPIIKQLLIALLCSPIILPLTYFAITFKISLWLYLLFLGIFVHGISTIWVLRKRLKLIFETTTQIII